MLDVRGDMGLIDGSLVVLITSGGHLERGRDGEEKKMGGWDNRKRREK
jgi:hypothetical protein